MHKTGITGLHFGIRLAAIFWCRKKLLSFNASDCFRMTGKCTAKQCISQKKLPPQTFNKESCLKRFPSRIYSICQVYWDCMFSSELCRKPLHICQGSQQQRRLSYIFCQYQKSAKLLSPLLGKAKYYLLYLVLPS